MSDIDNIRNNPVEAFDRILKLESELERVKVENAQLKADNELLKRQMDAARRQECISSCNGLGDPREVARKRGWDCFKDKERQVEDE